VEGFNVNAIDYLLKPFSFERFEQAVNRAHEYYNYQHQKQESSSRFIFIRADYRLTKINIADILLLKGWMIILNSFTGSKAHRYAYDHEGDARKAACKRIIRVHRSFIIPLIRIENVSNKMISLAGEEIPIGISYEAAFFKLFPVNQFHRSNSFFYLNNFQARTIFKIFVKK